MKTSQIEILQKLSETFAPSGYEDDLRQYIISQIQDHVSELYTDRAGNLIAKIGLGGNPYVFAHMDEIGFMITGIQENGTLRFSSIGGITPDSLPSKRVKIKHDDRFIYGVIGSKPVHFKDDKKEKKSFSNLYIHIGADKKQEAQKFVSVGDVAVFDTQFQVTPSQNRRFMGKALDNRIGCLLLITLIQDHLIPNGTFIFTVQEETGLRGSISFLSTNEIDFGLAVDTTTANDLPGISGANSVCSLKKGGVVSYIDGATVYRKVLIDAVFQLCRNKQIPLQTKTKKAGGNEASAIQKQNGSSHSISLSVPCRYIHGPLGVVSETDIDNSLKALVCILENWEELNHV